MINRLVSDGDWFAGAVPLPVHHVGMVNIGGIVVSGGHIDDMAVLFQDFLDYRIIFHEAHYSWELDSTWSLLKPRSMFSM